MILKEKSFERGSDREHFSLYHCFNLLFFFFRLLTKSQKSRVIQQTFTVFIGLTNLNIILR